MTQFKVKLSPPDIDPELFREIAERFTHSMRDPGQALRTFEQEITKTLDADYALCTNTGTAALHLALLSLGIGEGDEVLCPTFTFAATINAISYLKALPIIVDSELTGWNICPDFLEEAIQDRISKGKKPKALLIAHTYGMPAQLDRVISICKQYEILIIEDAAGSMGASYNGKALGTICDVGIYSFNYNKIITTAGGGMLVTKHKEIREKSAFLSTQAREAAPYYVHTEVGYNYQMNGMAAELGLAQLHLLGDRVKKKRSIFDHYHNNLKQFKGTTFQQESEGMISNRWLSAVVFEDPELPVLVKNHLANAGVEARHLWNPMHCQPVFDALPYYGSNRAEYLFQHGLALPSGTTITQEEQQNIVRITHDTLNSLMKS